MRYLTKKRAIRSPINPPPLNNHGYYIVSLNRLTAWLGEKCEEAGVNIFPEFPGADLLYDENDRVLGVRTGDKGIDKEGKPKANFEPGVDLRAKVTVLGEGPRGSLTKQLIERLGLDEGREPQVYSIGVKELWELPDDRYPAGRVTHTLGYPSDANTYGGGWIYGMQNRIINTTVGRVPWACTCRAELRWSALRGCRRAVVDPAPRIWLGAASRPW